MNGNSFNSHYTEFMVQEAKNSYMSAEIAVETLCREAKIRTVAEVLGKACGIPPERRDELIDCMTDRLVYTVPGVRRDSTRRKVQMWIDNDVQYLSKEGAIQVCFALGCSCEEAEVLICRLCGEGFHWRSPREIVFLYALRRGKTYAYALELLELLKRQEAESSDQEHPKEKKLQKKDSDARPDVMTIEVREKVEEIRSDEELKQFFRDNRNDLGTKHNTAYQAMMDSLNMLRQPAGDDRLRLSEQEKMSLEQFVQQVAQSQRDYERRDRSFDYEPEDDPELAVHFISAEEMSNREVLSTYLYNRIVVRTKSAAEDEKQAAKLAMDGIKDEIRRNWPEETGLSRIINRSAEVSRKLLILLFLATDGDNTIYQQPYYKQSRTADEAFDDRYARMDLMLTECGYAPLDPRSPFDWMVLYSMYTLDVLEIDERIRHFLMVLFQDDTSGDKQRK